MTYSHKTTYVEIDTCMFPGRGDCREADITRGEDGDLVTICLRCERLNGERANGEYQERDDG